jgi:hypothetical protein
VRLPPALAGAFPVAKGQMPPMPAIVEVAAARRPGPGPLYKCPRRSSQPPV